MNAKTIELNDKKIDLSSIQKVENDKPENEELDIQKDDILDELDIQQQIQPIFTPLTPEESLRRRELMIKINRYRIDFKDDCSDFISINLSTKSIYELENILQEIQLTVQNSGMNTMVLNTYSKSLQLVENFAPRLNMDLHGLSHICSNRPEINSIIKELSIEYTSSKIIPPQYRLAMITCGIVLELNTINKAKSAINDFTQKEIPHNIKDKYNDL